MRTIASSSELVMEHIKIDESHKNNYRFYRTDDLDPNPKNKGNIDYNDLKNKDEEERRIFSYIFGIIPKVNSQKKVESNEKAIVYPYRVMIKKEQYNQITE